MGEGWRRGGRRQGGTEGGEFGDGSWKETETESSRSAGGQRLLGGVFDEEQEGGVFLGDGEIR